MLPECLICLNLKRTNVGTVSADCFFLLLLFTVVEGMVPAINTEDYLKTPKPKRRIKPVIYENFKSVNLVETFIKS